MEKLKKKIKSCGEYISVKCEIVNKEMKASVEICEFTKKYIMTQHFHKCADFQIINFQIASVGICIFAKNLSYATFLLFSTRDEVF